MVKRKIEVQFSKPMSIAIAKIIRTFLYKNFKSIFSRTTGYKRWRTRREIDQDDGFLQKRLTEYGLMLQSSLHPDWGGVATLPLDMLFDAITNAMHPSKKRIILAFGHSNYCTVIGGIQLCLGIEQTEFSSTGNDYFYLYPAIPSVITLDDDYSETQIFGIIVNGKDLGYCAARDFSTAVSGIAKLYQFPVILIFHALLGHCINFLLNLKNQLNIAEVYFWIHDFYYLCPSAHLLFNNSTFCNAPSITSSECSACVYGEYRRSHLQRLRGLFECYSITAIAPSRFAMNFWKAKSDLPTKRTMIHNHTRMGQVRGITKPVNSPLQIGFMGARVYHKGWNTFANLADDLIDDKRYNFHAFTQTDPFHPNIHWCKVEVTNTSINAMIDALISRDIDIVILWSQSPETYSFTMHEAMTSGAFIITTAASGNISSTIQETNQGIVLRTDKELLAIFRTGKILEHYALFRSTGVHSVIVEHSKMTASILKNIN